MAYTITEAQAAELLKVADTIVGKQVKNGLIPESDRDDYIQELMLLMVQHQNDWTVPEGIDFSVYAYTVMEKRIYNIWEERHPKKDAMTDTVSLNSTFTNSDGDEEEFITLVADDGSFCNSCNWGWQQSREAFITSIEMFIITLPAKEQELCNALMTHGVIETAKILKIDRSTVWRMINSVRAKMISAGLSPQKKSKKD